jgi:hypothetical protein
MGQYYKLVNTDKREVVVSYDRDGLLHRTMLFCVMQHGD